MQINLLPKQSPVKTYLTIGMTLSVSLLLLGNVWVGITFVQTQNQLLTAESQLQQIQRKMPSLQAEADKAKKKQETSDQYQSLQRWSAQRPVLKEDVYLFSSLLPAGGYVTTVTYAGDQVYDVQAVLPNMDAVSTYFHELETHKHVAGIAVKNVKERQNAANPTNPAGTVYQMDLQVIVSRTTK